MSSKRLDPRDTASWRTFGIGLRKPDNYLELWEAFTSVKGNRRRSPQARIPDYNALVTMRPL
ncbi:hypothetical protein ACQEVF_11260 [Nonomuraea polychroma]|uniref:hypothetical protein n=1 Tax=Nonomuraea polychroma TaxID=46176 RepID=UPI003D8A9F31